jgi:hypothetical protein
LVGAFCGWEVRDFDERYDFHFLQVLEFGKEHSIVLEKKGNGGPGR